MKTYKAEELIKNRCCSKCKYGFISGSTPCSGYKNGKPAYVSCTKNVITAQRIGFHCSRYEPKDNA